MLRWLSLFPLLLFFTCAASEDDVLPEPEPLVETRTEVRYKTLAGVDPNLLSLDVYHAAGATDRRPVVVYVHGGGWSTGDKRNQIADKVALFRGEDYVFVSVNYRLSPVAVGPDYTNRIKFPDHNVDVADAIGWVVDNIADYGGDPGRVALLGHSAGAHLVALTATNPDFLARVGLTPSDLAGVIPVDTEGYDVAAQVAAGSDLYRNAFGDDPADHRAASPIDNVSPDGDYPPFLLVRRGTAARRALAETFADRLAVAGVTVVRIEANQYDHAGVNAAIGRAGETAVTEPLLGFLGECFGE